MVKDPPVQPRKSFLERIFYSAKVSLLAYGLASVPMIFLGSWPPFVALSMPRQPFLALEVILGLLPLSIAWVVLFFLLVSVPDLSVGDDSPGISSPHQFTIPILLILLTHATSLFMFAPITGLQAAVRLDQIWRMPFFFLSVLIWVCFGFLTIQAVARRRSQSE